MKSNVFLSGFMGCGKTTVGRLLARKLGRPFFDVDQEIEKKAGISVSEIFKTEGEDHFRELETAELKKLCQGRKTIISGGGGSIFRPGNFELICESCHTVYLASDFETVKKRIINDPSRPLTSDEDSLLKLYQSRVSEYEKCDFRIFTGERSPMEIVEEILEAMPFIRR